MAKKILIVSPTKKKYGGKVYEKMVAEALSENFEVEIKNFSTGLDRGKNYGFAIRNFDASLFFNPKPTKNIAILHHIDYSFAPWYIRAGAFFLTPIVFRNLRKFEAIVVVSKYWEKYFQEKGYKNTHLIYNAFNLAEFMAADEEAEEFKERYQLTDKPIIYLGNCQKAKGVAESYRALKDLNVHLVTSGAPQIKIPAQNLQVDYRDYLRLLKASSVVLAMSLFKEGWCRTAHEAMLLKTPVIGSGLGGMAELLEGGKQMVCRDFKSLKEKVEYLLNHSEIRELMGEQGFDFAKNFTVEKFKKDWLELINKLL